MRIAPLTVAGLAALALAACENRADKAAEAQADAVKAEANVAATNLENRAEAAEDAGDKAMAQSMEKQAEATREAADVKADAIERQAGKSETRP